MFADPSLQPSFAMREPPHRSRRLTRTLGITALATSPAFLARALLTDRGILAATRTGALLDLVFLAGWGCSALALWRVRAAGRGAGALAIVQAVGLGLATGQDAHDAVAGQPAWSSAAYRVADLAWPFSVLFMLVVGAAVVRAGVWRDWRRTAPVACGLTLPVAVLAGAVGGHQIMNWMFALLTTAAWAFLASAIAIEPSRRPTGR